MGNPAGDKKKLKERRRKKLETRLLARELAKILEATNAAAKK